MQWHIDSSGIHVNVTSLKELKEAVEEIEWRLTSTPRTVQEENSESMNTLVRMVAKSPGT